MFLFKKSTVYDWHFQLYPASQARHATLRTAASHAVIEFNSQIQVDRVETCALQDCARNERCTVIRVPCTF